MLNLDQLSGKICTLQIEHPAMISHAEFVCVNKRSNSWVYAWRTYSVYIFFWIPRAHGWGSCTCINTGLSLFICILMCVEDISHPRLETSWILAGGNHSNLYATPNPLAQTQTCTLDLRWAATAILLDQKICLILLFSLFGGVTLVLSLYARSENRRGEKIRWTC